MAEISGRIIGRIVRYRGKEVKIVENAAGFVKGPDRYWVRALEPVAGYETGEEFTVSKRHVYGQLGKTVL